MTRRELASYAQTVYRAFDMRSFDSEISADDLFEILKDPVIDDQVVGGANPAASPKDTEAIMQFVSELLVHRYVSDSVEEYKRWRRSRGYVLRPTRYLIEAYSVPEDYEIMFGEAYPGDDHFEKVFDRFWEYGLQRDDGSSRIVGVSRDPQTIVVAFGTISREAPGAWPIHLGTLGLDLWRGRTGAELRNWWSPPSGEFSEWLQDQGTLRCAIVSIVCEFASGRRFPVHLRFCQDARTGRWWFVGMGVSNDADGTVGTTEL